MRPHVLIAIHLAWLVGALRARGPHHPRGETVVKPHVHYMPQKGADIIRDGDLMHDTQHLHEHLEEIIEAPNLENLTDDQLDFYYFQLHDIDQNSHLDGLEILQAIQHTTHHQVLAQDGDVPENKDDTLDDIDLADLNYFTDLIDKVFAEDDLDDDGYLSYAEYKSGREKDAKEDAMPTPQALPSVEQV